MIVEPDFPSHWKTQLLIALVAEETQTLASGMPHASHVEPNGNPSGTHDEASALPLRTQAILAPEGAPMLVIRLWAHCQTRKKNVFPEMSNNALKAVTGWQGKALRVREILTEAGFIEEDLSQIVVHQWDEVNAKLFANWNNGPKGGRPKKQKEPLQKPPTDNPPITHCKPTGGAIDKIDKIEDSPRAGARVCERAEVLEKICPLFGTDPKRPLSAAVEFALTAALPIPADELQAVAWFYGQPAEDRVHELATRHRKLKTLFENWSDAAIEALAFAKKNGGDFSGEKKPARPEPEGWRERAQKKFGVATELPASFFDLPKSLQADADISGKGAAA